MELLQQFRQHLQPRLAVYSRNVLDLVPDGATGRKLGLIFISWAASLLCRLYWVWQKWHGTDIDTQVGKLMRNVDEIRQTNEELKTRLSQRLQAQDAAQGDSNKHSDGQLKSGLEKDIGAAIETLAEGGKKEALAALERGDTKAAEAALAEKIDQLDKARTGSAQKEAALYRQRGALAYLNDTQAALRDYAKAAELDPDDGEGLYFLGQLQARAVDRPAAKQSFERLIAQGDRVPVSNNATGSISSWATSKPTLEIATAALNHYKRGQALVQALIKRDPNNAEWQRDLSVSYDNDRRHQRRPRRPRRRAQSL